MSSEGNVSTDSQVFAGGPNSPVSESAPETPVAETASEPKVFDEAYVKSLREEAAKHRTEKQKQAKETESLLAKLAEFENAQLSESERSKKEFEETRTRADKNESRARELEIKYQLALAAVDPTNQIGDVKAAIKLLDRDTLEFDDSGKITNLQDALETLKAEYPSVVASARNPSAPNTGVTNPAKAPTAKKYTRADLAKMPAHRIVELQEAGELNHILGGGGR